MTILEQNTVVNFDKALIDEIIFLKDYAKVKSSMNLETFDPLDSLNCFIGQTVGVSGGRAYRDYVGRVSGSSVEFGGVNGHNDMTALEIWSARMWKAGRRGPVEAVFNFVKGDGELPLVVYAIN
jgi:hypothetical protein